MVNDKLAEPKRSKFLKSSKGMPFQSKVMTTANQTTTGSMAQNSSLNSPKIPTDSQKESNVNFSMFKKIDPKIRSPQRQDSQISRNISKIVKQAGSQMLLNQNSASGQLIDDARNTGINTPELKEL